jgi:hypothetical protein
MRSLPRRQRRMRRTAASVSSTGRKPRVSAYKRSLFRGVSFESRCGETHQYVVTSDVCSSGALQSNRTRETRRYFVCKLLQLAQESVQVGGHGFDHDAIDTSRAVLLDSPENCVGVAVKGGLGVAVSNEVSDTRPHAQRDLEFRLPSECVDFRYGRTHLLGRSPQAVPAVPQRRCALQSGRAVTSNKDRDAMGRSRR